MAACHKCPTGNEACTSRVYQSRKPQMTLPDTAIPKAAYEEA